jgi:hypothetical protein
VKLFLHFSHNTFPFSKLFIYLKQIFTNSPRKQGVNGLSVLSKFNVPNQLMINLDTRKKCSLIKSDSVQLKTPSVEDRDLVGASLHPQKDVN